MEGESQSEESSSSSSSSSTFLKNLFNILKSTSLDPKYLEEITQNLTHQYTEILSGLQLNPNQLSDSQNEIIINQLLASLSQFSELHTNFNPKIEKKNSCSITNDEETSTGSHCGENDNSNDESKLENIKKNNKKLQKFEDILDKMFLKLNIKNVDEIKTICLDVLNLIIPVLSEHFKNKPFEAVTAAVVVFSCRNANYPITLKEIVSASCAQGKDLTKMINKCIFSLKAILPENEFTTKILNPEAMAQKLIEKLNLDGKVLSNVLRLIKFIEARNLIKGKHPNTIAACAIKIITILYSEDRNGLCFELLAQEANLNKITLKNTYRDLYIHYKEILDEMSKWMKIDLKELPNL